MTTRSFLQRDDLSLAISLFNIRLEQAFSTLYRKCFDMDVGGGGSGQK
jgi:hypothetical protein